MPDDARKEASERLAVDLRSKREERGLSADDLQKKLNVPSSLLGAFEAGRLTDHPMFNRVYLRSLTRSYANAVGVPSAVALAALESALEGEYEEGQLQRELEAHEQRQEAAPGEAEQEEESISESTSESAAVESSAAAGAVGAGAATAATAAAEEEPDWTTQSPPGASPAEAEKRQREKEERAQAQQREREERASQQQGRGRQQQERSRQREQRSAGRRPGRSSGGVPSSWIIGGLVLLAVAVGGFFLVRSLGGDGTDAETAQATATAADTAAGGEEAAQQDQRPAANLQLGETMNFTVIAEGGPVRDLKVTRDQDVRRPYWIEEGQAKVFPAGQRIVIENPPEGQPTLGNVQLLAEGYPYPIGQRDAQDRIVITREDMQAFADTLRGQPVQPPAQRDTASMSGAEQ